MDAYSDTPIGLGSDARVRFILGDNAWIDIRVVHDSDLNVIGSSGIGVYPRSTNALLLRVV